AAVACGLAAGGRHLRAPPYSLPLYGCCATSGYHPCSLAVARRARKRRPYGLLPLRAIAPCGLVLAVGAAPLRAGRVGAAPVASPRAANPCSLVAGGRCPCGLVAGEQPLAGWPLAIALQPIALVSAVLQATMQAGRSLSPLCRGPWSQPVAPLLGALAITDRPYRRPGRGWPPILLLTTFTAKM
ncbi:hypothetical protein B296_00015028, partial [Ensete ventricosum]